MPIYAYKCSSCGFAKDALQKMSDAPLTVCPNCGASTFEKQVTAAGFQLKGSGWYVTDFRDGGGKKAAESKPAESTAGDKPADASSGKSDAPAAPPASAPAPTSAPAAAPAAAPAPASKSD
ncbi:FmdB family zinc ribbon protein [Variovorax sp. PAMC 28711]|uniref:FmdB family zinc ribbon protein n=1 Tax=Variovorax sp. PAMC 28711 TaxID=1795631 RepID=UPI00078ED290|nr:FmdB family zinc ribbon protein [Variovorax sp. PAMC 28711]AMM23788.1 FmdB family transcriptional regulator [Variovorax sp. PAMC 28711]